MGESWSAERIAEMRRALAEGSFMFVAGMATSALPSLLDELESARGGGWIAVTPETMPDGNVPVLAFYKNAMGNGRRVRAEWAPRFTLIMSDEADEFGAEYKDEEDPDGGTPYCPEGWYETNENEDVHWMITDPVLFWMPLPAPPVLP